MMRLIALTLAVTLLAGCAPATPLAASRAQAPVVARAKTPPLAAALRQNVVDGFTRIFTRYDDQPRDERLSFDEFGRVVTQDWFAEYDANNDGYLLFAEWLTPAEMSRQIAAITGEGGALVQRADQDGDNALTQAEFLAYTAFEVDPTPWLLGAPDPDIKRTAFKRHAAPDGALRAEAMARLMGDLLAQGYYLDDASQDGHRGRNRGDRPQPPAF